MSKIEVPQELIDQIINLYQQGYTRKAIKEKLNLNFGDSVIKRILVENNIEIRTNPGAQKGGRKKQEIDRETQDKIIELYNKGYGLDKIVRTLQLPFSFDKVRSILVDNNIHIRNLKEAYAVEEKPELRKYTVNDDYVLESHNGAWLMGFLAADGYLPITKGAKNRIVLTLQRRDEEILHIISNELDYTGPIYQFESVNGYEESSLSFCSKNIRQQLEKYGIVNNKTFKLHDVPNIPQEFILDFIRGYFDGDGSIFQRNDRNNKQYVMSFTCANLDFLTQIRDILTQYNLSKIKIHQTERVHIIYDMRYGKKEDTAILSDLLYNNDYLALPRKKEKALELLFEYGY